MARAKVIAIANQKGGVGKTMTAVSLAFGLAKFGKKVLLIDSDAQGSLSISLGVSDPDAMDDTLATVFGRIITDEPISKDDCILHISENVDLLPGNIELSGIETSLVNAMKREEVLSRYIHQVVEDEYDYIIIDCMPSLGMITINVLACADSVIIPVQAAYLSLKGLQQLFKTLGLIKRQINSKLAIEGILFTFVDKRTNNANDIMDVVKEAYGSHVRIFKSTIPHSVRAAETPAAGICIYEYDPHGTVAKAYLNFTKEVLEDEC